ncbi:MAG: HPr(Ser) kinase/phosphatase [Burkholderiaceae bacterium]
MTTTPPTVRVLFEQHRDDLQLGWRAGHDGGDRAAAKAGAEPADLIGYLNLIHPDRIHVFGPAERAYTRRLSPERQNALLDELITARPPAIVIANGLEASPELIERADRDGLPVLTTPQSAAHVIEAMRLSLARAVAQHCSLHGVCMDVLGMGVLISGESGLGKSELALELISRGHGLVADDVVELSRIAPSVIEARCPPLLQNLLEVRGLGLLDIRTIFGETAVRRKMKLNLIVHLVRTRTMEDQYPRMPLEAQYQEVLGLPVRKVVIPVAAGRNLAVLAEAAVRSAILQLRGIDTTGDFIVRQRALIEAQG